MRLLGSLALAVAMAAESVSAARITVDPDAFPSGAEISFAFPDVVLSAFGSGSLNGPDVSTPQVFSRVSAIASTGNRVFGNSSYSNLWFSDSAEFRADFAQPTNFVSLDLIADDGFDPSVLRAFDATGALLEQAAVSGAAGAGVAETAAISRPSAEISYIIATNPTGMAGQQFLIDRMIYESTSFLGRGQTEQFVPNPSYRRELSQAIGISVQVPEPDAIRILGSLLTFSIASFAPRRFVRRSRP